jgi:glutamine synthetase
MSPPLQTPDDVRRAVKDHKIQSVDLRFTDLAGKWHKVSAPPAALGRDSFKRGIDLGAKVLGFEEAREYGVVAVPDPSTAFRDPFSAQPTLAVICNLRDAKSGQNYARDPRSIAQKAEAYLLKTDIGNSANFGVQLEYSFLNGAASDVDREAERRSISSVGAKLRATARRTSVLPLELLHTVRREIAETLGILGIEAEVKSDDVTLRDDGRIDMRFTTLTRMADNVMICRYVVANVANRNGATATFGPSGSNSGLGVHQSLWVGEQPLFAGDGYAGTAALLRHYLAGLVEHAPVLLAICAPTAAADHGHMPGFKAPVKLGHLPPKQSAASRGLIDLSDARARRVEFCCPDALCNPYLTFAAMLMAGIDGFENRLYNLEPTEPIEKFYRLQPHELMKMPLIRGRFDDSSEPTEADHAFLFKGGVFTQDVIAAQFSAKAAG